MFVPPQRCGHPCDGRTSRGAACLRRTTRNGRLVVAAEATATTRLYVRPMTPTIRSALHLSALPDERARAAPDARCVDDDRLELTNAEFAGRVRAVAADFRSRGVGPGDVVAAMLPNRVELIVAMFAAWRVGAALTPINPSLTTAEASYQIVDSGARLLVADGQAVDAPGVAVLDVADLSTNSFDRDADAVADPSAVALLIYTSGTTGSPKGVMLDHANLSAMTAMVVDALELTADDHCLLILPLFHV